jgi:hypothetical protein
VVDDAVNCCASPCCAVLCCAVLCCVPCIHTCRYDTVVTFLDPITKYNNVQGYMFNIRMLKAGEPAAAHCDSR